jgi:FkbM family methyltransferase
MTDRSEEYNSSPKQKRRCLSCRSMLVGLSVGIVLSSARSFFRFLPEGIAATRNIMARVPSHPRHEKNQIQEQHSFLDLPPFATSIVLNIGSNRDPILPKQSAGPCALTIAFEPIFPELIPHHPQIFVVPAAVSDTASLATMYAYNNHGASSSLSKPAQDSFWNSGKKNKGIKIVPVISMKDVLNSIPPNATIDFIQTDTQGYDFAIIRSSIQEIRQRNVKFLKTETWTDNTITYKGVDNDLCQHWIPFMTEHGYELVGTVPHDRTVNYMSHSDVMQSCQSQLHMTRQAGLKEADALWKLSSLTEDILPSVFEYPIHQGGVPSFTNEEYAGCRLSRAS